MTRPPPALVAAGAFVLLLGIGLTAGQWPQFRGPGGQGESHAVRLPLEWSETSNVAWKVPVPGLGWSSPVVADGRVWLTTAIEDDPRSGDVSLRLLGYDEASGRELVNVVVFTLRATGEINPKNSWASPTPIVEGDRVFVHFGAEGTAALDTRGQLIWKSRFPYQSQHGGGGSPVLHRGMLIFNADGSDNASVIALDAATGKVKWRRGRRVPFDQAYSTPLVIQVGDREQIVSVGAFRAAAYEPSSGREIWRVSYGDGFSNVPRPVFTNGLVLIATGFQQPSLLAVRPDGTGDVTKTHLAWQLRRGAPLTPSPIAVGAEIYFVSDGGIASCVDAPTGATLWQQRLGGTYSASPVLAAGYLFFPSEQGVTTVIQPGREYRRVARNTLDGSLLASMAIADDAIIMRSDSSLYRLRQSRNDPWRDQP
jgi:outer membrane protein assembly factor BamB